jgi:hypothetical protein
MNSLDIILWLAYPALAYFSFRYGFLVGYDRGNIEGRKAVREYYEQVGR